MVTMLLLYAGVCLVPAAVLYALAWAWRVWTGERPRPSWPVHRHTVPPPTPAHPPIEQLLVDLHCLGRELDLARTTTAPAKVHRMRAVSLAYDDVLTMCCEELDVPVPVVGRRPLEAAERLQLEAGLARTGARW